VGERPATTYNKLPVTDNYAGKSDSLRLDPALDGYVDIYYQAWRNTSLSLNQAQVMVPYVYVTVYFVWPGVVAGCREQSTGYFYGTQ
jgi:hypothetical protein